MLGIFFDWEESSRRFHTMMSIDNPTELQIVAAISLEVGKLPVRDYEIYDNGRLVAKCTVEYNNVTITIGEWVDSRYPRVYRCSLEEAESLLISSIDYHRIMSRDNNDISPWLTWNSMGLPATYSVGISN